MNLATLLEKTSTSFPNNHAMAEGQRVISSYGEMAQRVARLAGGLLDKYKLSSGDRIALAMKNCPDYSDILFATWHAGCAAVPMNHRLHQKEFAYVLENSGARLCFVTKELKEVLSNTALALNNPPVIISVDSSEFRILASSDPISTVEVDSNSLAWLFYTSGTTGQSKGAMLTHRNLLMMTISYFGDVDNVSSADTILHAAPMSHGSGLYILPYVAKGACQVIPESRKFEPFEFLNILRYYNNVNCFLAPTMVKEIIKAQEKLDMDLKNLKTIVYGGAPMYTADCLKAIDVFGPKLIQIYGQGEAPMTITCLSRAAHMETDNPNYQGILESVGTPRTDVEVIVVDENNQPCLPGNVGEILVRGDVVMKGYWRNEEASLETLKRGWLHTGDVGSFDISGHLTLKDRSKDLIISGGSNIYPREVEEILLQHPEVQEISVVGRQDSKWGESVAAFIVPTQNTNPDISELDALCLKNIARFKRPKEYFFIDELPKNNYGKVLKRTLRDLLENEESGIS